MHTLKLDEVRAIIRSRYGDELEHLNPTPTEVMLLDRWNTRLPGMFSFKHNVTAGDVAAGYILNTSWWSPQATAVYDADAAGARTPSQRLYYPWPVDPELYKPDTGEGDRLQGWIFELQSCNVRRQLTAAPYTIQTSVSGEGVRVTHGAAGQFSGAALSDTPAFWRTVCIPRAIAATREVMISNESGPLGFLIPNRGIGVMPGGGGPALNANHSWVVEFAGYWVYHPQLRKWPML